MTWTRSIELRLTAWYAAMLFAGFALLGAVLWSAVGYALESSVDARLEARMERLEAMLAAETEEEEDTEDFREEMDEEIVDLVAALPEGRFAQVRSDDGKHLVSSRVALSFGMRELETDEADGQRYRVHTKRFSFGELSYDVLLASSLEDVEAVRRRMILALGVVTPVALLFCGGGGFTIARAALRPVDEITAAATEMTVSRLSERIPATGSKDSLDRLAMAFNAMLERLEASVAKLEQFSADASHELRTPLSVIRTTAELALRHGRTEESYRRDLEEIQVEAERLGSLIEVLLALSRDASSVAMVSLDLRALVASVCAQFERDASAKGLKLVVDLPESAVPVRGNDAALRRMTASLLENAIAYTESGEIAVALDRSGEKARLRVRDTGAGIPPDALGRVFDRFYRVDRSRSRASGGYGLGLSIAKRVAELHHAELGVESEPGVGSTFIATFIVEEL